VVIGKSSPTRRRAQRWDAIGLAYSVVALAGVGAFAVAGFHLFTVRFAVAFVLLLAVLGWFVWKPRPIKLSSESQSLHARFVEIGKAISQIPRDEAKQRVWKLLEDSERFTLTKALATAVPVRDDLPTDVRELFSRYGHIEWYDSVARLGVKYVGPSMCCEGFIAIGYMCEDDDVEVAVKPGDSAVYELDRFDGNCDSFDESTRFPSIYHWFLFTHEIQ